MCNHLRTEEEKRKEKIQCNTIQRLPCMINTLVSAVKTYQLIVTVSIIITVPKQTIRHLLALLLLIDEIIQVIIMKHKRGNKMT
jgi:hypothetical protein